MHYLVYCYKKHYDSKRISLVPELIYLTGDKSVAINYLKEKCIRYEIENLGTKNFFTIEYYILPTESGPFDHDDIYNDDSCIKLIKLVSKEKYCLDDFLVEGEESLISENDNENNNLQEFINILNQRLSEIHHINEENAKVVIDQNSEMYRRYIADRQAYTLMKIDGLAPPNPAFRNWSLSQLQNLTFKDYIQNLPKPERSAEHGGMFI